MNQNIRRILGWAGFIVLVALNFFLVYPWFQGDGPANIGSIEVSYVSMARFIRDFRPHLSWAPFWYFGFPFNVFYTPLLPAGEYLLNQATGAGLWQAYRILSGAGLVLAPAMLFLFVWQITKKILPGLIASLCYTFLPTLFYFVLPSGEVARDMISQGAWDPRRLTILVRWGEGPHTLGVIFLWGAGIFFDRLLCSRKKADMAWAAFFTALTALTNAVALTGLVLLLGAIFLAHLCQKQGHPKSVVKMTLITALASYGLIAFWYNLPFIRTFFSEGGGLVNRYLALFPWGFFVLSWVIFGLYYFFRSVVKNQATITAVIWFIFCFGPVLAYYLSAPPELSDQRIEYLPQVLRLMIEADMALAVLIGALVAHVTGWLGAKGATGRVLGYLAQGGLITGFLIYGYRYIPYGQKAMAGAINLSQTAEYDIAGWLNQHVDRSKGERVFAAGNYSFYLNYFTDIWQLRGGLYQAKTHFWPEHIYFQLVNGKDSRITEAWLKIANIKYAVINTAASRELYKEFKHPEKFQSLPVAYQNQGDTIYEISHSGPAKVVNLDWMSTYRPPVKADDKEPLFAYEQWLDQAAPADFTMLDNDHYQVSAEVQPRQGILVQMTYDTGFRAKSDRGKIGIRPDPLGFMVLVPAEAGPQTITVSRRTKISTIAGYAITVTTIGMLIWAQKGHRRKTGTLP